MQVFHLATAVDGQFCLWAEDSTRPPQHPPKPGRPPKTPEPRAHPFAVDIETVRCRGSGLNPPLPTEAWTATELTLLLPSGRFGPEPSPAVVRDEALDGPIDRVSPWTVPALVIEPEHLDTIFDALADDTPGVVAGETIEYWSTVSSVADELVRGGRVVPHLEIQEDHGIAVWRALPSTSEDFDRLKTLRESMPPLARARVTEDVRDDAMERGSWDAATVQSARDVLVQGLDVCVDAGVRKRLTTVDHGETDAVESTDMEGIHREWLAALARPDGTINADPDVLQQVRNQLDAWTQSLQTAGEQGVRLCLRLYAPDPAPNTDVESDSEAQRAVHGASDDRVDETVAITDDELADQHGNQSSSPSAVDEIEIDAVSTEGWELELLLQAGDDPSVLVEAGTVWESAEATQQALERHLDRPQETLLEELGRAASLYPKLEAALETATPTTLDLTTAEADEFLREYAEILEQAGIGIILPAWWNEPERRLGARLTVERQDGTTAEASVGSIGVDQLCDVRWEVVLGGEPLSKAELEELAALKRPLVRMRGEWVSLRESDIENALALYENTDDELTIAEALQADTGLADNDPDLPIVDQQFEGSLADLFDTELAEWITEAETPAGFDGELRPYQKRGLGWITYLETLGFGGCLADDMGLGKTIQILARLVEERERDRDRDREREHESNPEPEPEPERDTPIGPTMVVCPLSVVGNWNHEAESFAPQLETYVHHGTDRRAGDALTDAIASHDLIVTTYGVVRNDIEELATIEFHRVVLDEAQKIKNTGAKRTQAVRQLSARHRFALTGTPVENRLSELWSIMEFCNPGLLGSETAFRDIFARPIERYGDERKTEQLRRLIRPFVLRRSKTDETVIDDLPEKIETKEYCTLTEEQASLYKAATDELLGDVEQASGMERRGKVLELITALKAICNHPRQYHEDGSRLEGRSGKLDRLEDLVTEILASGERTLVFTQYTSMAELIRDYLQQQLGCRVLYLHGGTPQERRDEMVDAFQSADENGTEASPPVFLLSLRAGGTGLTLTAANHVIHYDRWWNPAVEDQATDRTYRIGQTDDVQVHNLICEGTVEEAIDRTIEQKRQLAEQVLAEGEEWLTELSDEELRDIVTLSEGLE